MVMPDRIPPWDAMGPLLLGKLDAALKRSVQELTRANDEAYRQALKTFLDWTLPKKLPEDSK